VVYWRYREICIEGPDNSPALKSYKIKLEWPNQAVMTSGVKNRFPDLFISDRLHDSLLLVNRDVVDAQAELQVM
jgi:hypothetical protein